MKVLYPWFAGFSETTSRAGIWRICPREGYWCIADLSLQAESSAGERMGNAAICARTS
jgi:hypothetical protein